MCITQASDIDLLLVHPRRAEEAASTVRRRLTMDIAEFGSTADISVLSQRELASTGFWKAEDVVDLAQFTAACANAM